MAAHVSVYLAGCHVVFHLYGDLKHDLLQNLKLLIASFKWVIFSLCLQICVTKVQKANTIISVNSLTFIGLSHSTCSLQALLNHRLSFGQARLTTLTTGASKPWLTVTSRLMTPSAVLFAKMLNSSFTQSTNNPVSKCFFGGLPWKMLTPGMKLDMWFTGQF